MRMLSTQRRSCILRAACARIMVILRVRRACPKLPLATAGGLEADEGGGRRAQLPTARDTSFCPTLAVRV